MRKQKNFLFIEKQQRFSVRKLTIGVCSVLLATFFIGTTNSQSVKAGTTDTESSSSTTSSTQTNDEQNNSSSENAESKTTDVSETAAAKDNTTSGSTTSSSQTQSADSGTSTSTNNSSSKTGSTTADTKSDTGGTASNADNTNDSKTASNAGSINSTTQTKKIMATSASVKSTESDTEEPITSETRTAIVKYIDASTGKEMTGLEPAVLEVYYTRTATKDATTGEYKYGVWNWDKTKGDSSTPGYHVVSGTWTSLPEDWNVVAVAVPTVSGYTAITQGDWEHLANSTTVSSVAANLYVSPYYTQAGISYIGTQDSIAYSDKADNYESSPVHVIYYVPDKTKTVTRTINVINPDNTTTTTTQTVTLTQKATAYSETTGATYGDWSTGTWEEYTVPTIAGYTASQTTVPEETVTGTTEDTTVNITYTANDQTGHIYYYDTDDNNKLVQTDTLTGKTGDTVTINLNLPNGYELVPGQDIPTSEQATADGIPDVSVKLQHKRSVIVPDNSDDSSQESEPTTDNNNDTSSVVITPPKAETNDQNSDNNKQQNNNSKSSNTTNVSPKATTVISKKKMNSKRLIVDKLPTKRSKKSATLIKTVNKVNSKRKENPTKTTVKIKKAGKTLPQTGTNNSVWIVIIGLLAAGLGLFSLVGTRKHEKEKSHSL